VGREAGTTERHAHLFGDGQEEILEDFEVDRADLHGLLPDDDIPESVDLKLELRRYDDRRVRACDHRRTGRLRTWIQGFPPVEGDFRRTTSKPSGANGRRLRTKMTTGANEGALRFVGQASSLDPDVDDFRRSRRVHVAERAAVQAIELGAIVRGERHADLVRLPDVPDIHDLFDSAAVRAESL